MKSASDVGQITEKLRRSGDRDELSIVAKGQATAGLLALEVMHEIKNPLEALGHLTYLAFESADDPDKVREYMRLAEEQMGTISRIASQTLSFAKYSHDVRSTELVGLTDAAVRIHQRTLESRKIHLVRKTPEKVIASIRRGEILQVISNLIANALDALPDDGTLTLKLCKQGGRVHFVVSDNGSGIAAEHVERIFDPFFTTKDDRGTGLGLALSKKIVEGHRGTIRLRSSVRPGRSGTTFRVSLPLEEVQ